MKEVWSLKLKFGYHVMGKIWFWNANTLFFKYMQLAVHLNSTYLEKLEFINQTPVFPLCILYEKIKKWTQYGHAILAHLLRQNTNFFITTALITNIVGYNLRALRKILISFIKINPQNFPKCNEIRKIVTY